MSGSTTSGAPGKPDWRPRAVRCGLEVTLIVLSTTYLTLNLGSGLLSGVVLVVGLLSTVVVLFWCLDDLVVDWVRYASNQAQRRRRRRKRMQRDRRRGSGDSEE